MLATYYAQDYGIDPQKQNESDQAFKERVAENLRRNGQIIEAHEVMAGKRWDDSSGAMTGIVGAVAKAMHGKHYAGSEIASDIAAGVVTQEPDDPLRDALLVAMVMMGN